MEEDYFIVITKEKWLEEIAKWQAMLQKLINRYTKLLKYAKPDNKKMISELLEETKIAYNYNKKAIVRAEVEEDFLVYKLDMSGVPVLDRFLVGKRVYKRPINVI